MCSRLHNRRLGPVTVVDRPRMMRIGGIPEETFPVKGGQATGKDEEDKVISEDFHIFQAQSQALGLSLSQ